MDEQDKKMKIEFAPGAFDEFQGTQEELDEFIAEIKNLAIHGNLFEQAKPVDMDALAEEDPKLYETLVRKLTDLEDKKDTRKLN